MPRPFGTYKHADRWVSSMKRLVAKHLVGGRLESGEHYVNQPSTEQRLWSRVHPSMIDKRYMTDRLIYMAVPAGAYILAGICP